MGVLQKYGILYRWVPTYLISLFRKEAYMKKKYYSLSLVFLFVFWGMLNSITIIASAKMTEESFLNTGYNIINTDVYIGNSHIYVGGRYYKNAIVMRNHSFDAEPEISFDVSGINSLSFATGAIDNDLPSFNNTYIRVYGDHELLKEVHLDEHYEYNTLYMDLSGISLLEIRLEHTMIDSNIALVSFNINCDKDDIKDLGILPKTSSKSTDFLKRSFNNSANAEVIINESSTEKMININNTMYSEGIVFSDDGSISFNVENIDSISFEAGSVNNEDYANKPFSVVADYNTTLQEFTIEPCSLICKYTFDVSKYNILTITNNNYTGIVYGFVNFSINGKKTSCKQTSIKYKNDVDFINGVFYSSEVTFANGINDDNNIIINGKEYETGMQLKKESAIVDGQAYLYVNCKTIDKLMFKAYSPSNSILSIHLDNDTNLSQQIVGMKEYVLDVSDYSLLSLFTTGEVDIVNIKINPSKIPDGTIELSPAVKESNSTTESSETSTIQNENGDETSTTDAVSSSDKDTKENNDIPLLSIITITAAFVLVFWAFYKFPKNRKHKRKPVVSNTSSQNLTSPSSLTSSVTVPAQKAVVIQNKPVKPVSSRLSPKAFYLKVEDKIAEMKKANCTDESIISCISRMGDANELFNAALRFSSKGKSEEAEIVMVGAARLGSLEAKKARIYKKHLNKQRLSKTCSNLETLIKEMQCRNSTDEEIISVVSTKNDGESLFQIATILNNEKKTKEAMLAMAASAKLGHEKALKENEINSLYSDIEAFFEKIQGIDMSEKEIISAVSKKGNSRLLYEVALRLNDNDKEKEAKLVMAAPAKLGMNDAKKNILYKEYKENEINSLYSDIEAFCERTQSSDMSEKEIISSLSTKGNGEYLYQIALRLNKNGKEKESMLVMAAAVKLGNKDAQRSELFSKYNEIRKENKIKNLYSKLEVLLEKRQDKNLTDEEIITAVTTKGNSDNLYQVALRLASNEKEKAAMLVMAAAAKLGNKKALESSIYKQYRDELLAQRCSEIEELIKEMQSKNAEVDDIVLSLSEPYNSDELYDTAVLLYENDKENEAILVMAAMENSGYKYPKDSKLYGKYIEWKQQKHLKQLYDKILSIEKECRGIKDEKLTEYIRVFIEEYIKEGTVDEFYDLACVFEKEGEFRAAAFSYALASALGSRKATCSLKNMSMENTNYFDEINY